MNYTYINLYNAIDRRKNIECCMASSSLKLKRIEAILGRESDIKINGLSDSQTGCYLTHLKVLKKYTDSHNHLMILEDDSFFDNSIVIADELISNLKDNWDIIYLDSTIVEVSDYIDLSRKLFNHLNNKNSIDHFISKINTTQTIFGTHGYIVNKKSIGKLANILIDGMTLGKPIDNIYSINVKNKKINSYIILPTLISPSIDTVNSQISENEHPLMKDWINFRELISTKKFSQFNNLSVESFLNDLQIGALNIIQNRLKFSFFGEFTP